MKIDGIDFDQAWAKAHTEAEFVKEFNTEHMGHIYPEAKDKAEKLKRVYAILVPKPEVKPEKK